MAPADSERFRADLLNWAESNLRTFPWRDDSRSLYEVFIAEFFLTQTPAENTEQIYPEFLRQFPSLRHIREASQSELAGAIEPIGFHNMRAEALIKIADKYDQLPSEVDALLELPRVGPYVANATLCFGNNQRKAIVDRNVSRVYRRVFDERVPHSGGDQREFAKAILPEGNSEARTYNFALLDFGAVICKKQEPLCERCFTREYCSYYQSEIDED